MADTKELVKKISSGVVGSLVDILIWQVALVGASIGKTGSRGVYEAFTQADKLLEKVNHRSLSSTWHQLFKKRLLTYERRKNLYSPQITEYGRKRLAEKIPSYQMKRPWDGKIYLITYDIPEQAKIRRDRFRRFLKEINSRRMAESTYLNIYNPRKLITDYILKWKIPGIIIVSDMGKDGGVGEISMQDLLVRVYQLEDINDRYDRFIKNAKSKSLPLVNKMFEYLSILKDDPQLPFELLPIGWLGDSAFKYYIELKKRYINTYAIA